MLLLQASQLLAQRTFVLVVHRHRWSWVAPVLGSAPFEIIIAFATGPFKRAEKTPSINGFTAPPGRV